MAGRNGQDCHLLCTVQPLASLSTNAEFFYLGKKRVGGSTQGWVQFSGGSSPFVGVAVLVRNATEWTRHCLPFSSPFHTRHCCWCPAIKKILMTGIGVSQLQSGRHLFYRGGRGWRKGAKQENDHMDLCISMYYMIIRLTENTWLWQPGYKKIARAGFMY